MAYSDIKQYIFVTFSFSFQFQGKDNQTINTTSEVRLVNKLNGFPIIWHKVLVLRKGSDQNLGLIHLSFWMVFSVIASKCKQIEQNLGWRSNRFSKCKAEENLYVLSDLIYNRHTYDLYDSPYLIYNRYTFDLYDSPYLIYNRRTSLLTYLCVPHLSYKTLTRHLSSLCGWHSPLPWVQPSWQHQWGLRPSREWRCVLPWCVPGCTRNMLRLNDGETEVNAIRPTSVAQHRLPYTVIIGSTAIEATDAARNIGVMSDSVMTSELYMLRICAARHITIYTALVVCGGISANSVPDSLFIPRNFKPKDFRKVLVHTLVISRLDGCGSVWHSVTSPTACAECLRQNGTEEGQVRACNADVQGASLVAHQKPHPVQSTVTHVLLNCLHELGPEYLRDLLDCYNTTARTLQGLLASYSSVDPWCGPPLEECAFSYSMLLQPSGMHSPLRVRPCTSLALFQISVQTHWFIDCFNWLFITILNCLLIYFNWLFNILIDHFNWIICKHIFIYSEHLLPLYSASEQISEWECYINTEMVMMTSLLTYPWVPPSAVKYLYVFVDVPVRAGSLHRWRILEWSMYTIVS